MVRWLFALVLILGTFNPTDHSYYHWVAGWTPDQMPLKALVGVVLLIGYVIYLRATLRSIGPVGLILAALFFGAIIWVLFDFRILNLDEPTAVTWVALVVIATILAVGISWSHVRRRVTGQADIDDVDD